MIIPLAQSKENEAAIKALLRADSSETVYDDDVIDESETTLTLVDIVADSIFEPKKLAKVLIDKGFAATQITTIQMLVSDLKPGRPILGLATELCHEILRLLPGRTLRILVPHDLNSPTLLAPPDAEVPAWRLYDSASAYWSLSATQTACDFQGRLADYQNVLTHKVFHGDLSGLLKKPTYMVRSEEVKAQYKEEDDLAYSSQHRMNI